MTATASGFDGPRLPLQHRRATRLDAAPELIDPPTEPMAPIRVAPESLALIGIVIAVLRETATG